MIVVRRRMGVIIASTLMVMGVLTPGLLTSSVAAQTMRSDQVPVTYRVNTNDPVVFITIDDGITQSDAVAQVVRRKKLPVTSFLTWNTVRGDNAYFSAVSRFDSVQNHTLSHPVLTGSGVNVRREICAIQRPMRQAFGARPYMFRPPYGVGPRDTRIQSATSSCGIRHIVMWDAVVDRGRLQTWNGSRLSKGSIILLHYTPNLGADLKVALAAARAQGLRPAPLRDYLR